MSCGSFYINHLEGDAWWGMLPPLSTLKKGGVSMKEEWKPVNGYEGRYLISNYGRLISTNYDKKGNWGYVKPKTSNTGYLFYILYMNGNRQHYLAHKLVALHFLDNPNNYPVINHKDEDINNNYVGNLEWCTRSYNVLYSLNLHPERPKPYEYRTGRRVCKPYKHSKELFQFDDEMNLIATYENVIKCSKENGFRSSSIVECCKGKRKHAYGYIWRFAE